MFLLTSLILVHLLCVAVYVNCGKKAKNQKKKPVPFSKEPTAKDTTKGQTKSKKSTKSTKSKTPTSPGAPAPPVKNEEKTTQKATDTDPLKTSEGKNKKSEKKAATEKSTAKSSAKEKKEETNKSKDQEKDIQGPPGRATPPATGERPKKPDNLEEEVDPNRKSFKSLEMIKDAPGFE